MLPMPWWQDFSRLWECILQTGDLPATWSDARVALLPKPDGDVRPLTLATVGWRLGTSIINRELAA